MPETAVVSIKALPTYLDAKVDCQVLDHESIVKAKTDLKAAVADHPALSLILDLTSVEFMPSLALGAFVEVHHGLRRNDRKLCLVGLSKSTHEIIKLTRLDNLFEIHETKEAAIGAL